MARGGKPRAVTASFSYVDDAESKRLLDLADELADKDSRSRSWIIMEALREYVAAHHPGNPQTDIRVYNGQVEPPRGRPKPEAPSAYAMALRGIRDEGKMRWEDVEFCVKHLKMTREQAVVHLKGKGYAE